MKLHKHWLGRALLLSVLLHLLAILGAGSMLTWQLLARAAAPDAPPQKTERPLVFQLTETPESARVDQPVDNPQFVSDKTARAQNPQSPENLPIDAPYSDGVIRSPLPPEQRSQTEPASPQPQPQPADLAENQIAPQRRSEFRPELLRPESDQRADRRAANGELDREKDSNTDSRAPDFGSFSLSTYDWDFAPYLLRLKRRIERNIFPPPAFTYMGIISGRTSLKFRIGLDGKLEVLEVIEYQGHESLRTTSVRAVEVSAPFEPLPKDFPDNFLEITARFDYIIKRY